MARVRKLTVRPRILERGARSIEGIWVQPAKPDYSGSDPMSAAVGDMKGFLGHDVLLTALVIIPASIAWVFYDSLLGGVALGAGIYLAFEHGLPVFKMELIDFKLLVRAYKQIRETIFSRVRRA